MRILIADDDQQVRDSLRRYLEDQGHDVLQARNGREALNLWDDAELLLLDLMMPEMGGLDVLHALASRGGGIPRTGADGGPLLEGMDLQPIIVISGVSEVSQAVAALRAGAWDYLVKPVADLGLLDHAIARAVDRRALMLEVRQYQQGLEEQVRQRTAELNEANQALERKAVALKEVLLTVQAEKKEAAEGVVARIQEVMPLLRRLREQAPANLDAMVANIEQALAGISSASEPDPLARLVASLTPTELRMCRMIRQGSSSKEIARLEGISAETVDTHRKNIRTKLNIRNEKVNLAAYLQSLQENW